MKKRILSFVLAAMMVVMVFAIPTTVAGAVSNNYSYKFEDTDIRNYVDGQVFDVAAKGESEKAPRMDGVISEGEYAVAGSIPRNSNAGKALDSLPISFAVRNGYLYVAFKYEGEKQQAKIQYDIGVLQDHRSDGAYSRKQASWNVNGTTSDHTYLFKVPGTNTWANTSLTNSDSDLFLVDMCHGSDGTYEAKFDIGSWYNVFENSCRGNDIYKTPCVTVAFFYDVDAKTEVGQTHYAFPISGGAKIDSEVKADWAPATVIIPEKTLASIAKKNVKIGALGEDPRNMVNGQLAKVDKYATSSPTLDGKVSADEYTVMNHQIVSDYQWTAAPINASYSVSDDGYMYVALSYAIASQPASIHFQYGITGANFTSMISRVRASLKADGTFSYGDPLFGDAKKAGGFNTVTFTANQKVAQRSIEGYATTFEGGIATYEIKINIKTMVYAYESAGWDADYANCFTFMLWPDNAKQVGYKITADQAQVIKNMNSLSYVPGGANAYVNPTVDLPEGTTTKFHYHSSKNVTMIKTPTHYADGLCEYVCDSCGFEVKNEIVPRTLDHEFAKPEVHNADFHKIVCPCGFAYYEDHNWDKGELVKGTIADGRDKMLYTCVDCGEEKEEIVPSAATQTEPVATTTPAPTTEAPTTVAPTTEAPTTVAPTTEAPTTVAPTTAAPTTKAPEVTTEAPKSNGCGSVVTLSALALVPMLGAAVVFGKKRED